MISFEMPERIKNELQMAEMVARQVMRPNSRKYDEHEHERPVEYINIMWQVLREQNKRRYEKSAAARRQRRPPAPRGSQLVDRASHRHGRDAQLGRCRHVPLYARPAARRRGD
jgi:hypothetical protein